MPKATSCNTIKKIRTVMGSNGKSTDHQPHFQFDNIIAPLVITRTANKDKDDDVLGRAPPVLVDVLVEVGETSVPGEVVIVWIPPLVAEIGLVVGVDDGMPVPPGVVVGVVPLPPPLPPPGPPCI